MAGWVKLSQILNNFSTKIRDPPGTTMTKLQEILNMSF